MSGKQRKSIFSKTDVTVEPGQSADDALKENNEVVPIINNEGDSSVVIEVDDPFGETVFEEPTADILDNDEEVLLDAEAFSDTVENSEVNRDISADVKENEPIVENLNDDSSSGYLDRSPPDEKKEDDVLPVDNTSEMNFDDIKIEIEEKVVVAKEEIKEEQVMSEMTKEEAAKVEQNAARAQMLGAIPTPVMGIDKEFNVTFMNEAGANAVGMSSENCIGQKCFNLFKTGHCNTANCAVARAMQQNQNVIAETEAALPGGTIPIRYTGTALKDKNGAVVGGLEYILDISKEMAVTKEIENLVEGTIAGKLDYRGAVDSFDGNYKLIIKGVNDTLDAIIAPLNMMAEYVDRISKGDIPEKISDDYKGDFNEVKNNLNLLIDSLNGVIGEVLLMADAAIIGKLEFRGDEDKFGGDFGAIVKGVNKGVAAIVGHLDAVPTPTMIIDKEFNIRYMSKAGAEVVGVSQEQLIGKKCYDHFKTSDCNTPNCACARAMGSNSVQTSEAEAHPAGKNLSISYTGVPVRDQDGQIIGALEIVMDQTAVKAAIFDASLKVGYLNKIPTPAMAIDTDFNVTFMNGAGSQAVGVSQEDCVGQKCYNLFKTGDCNTANCAVGRAMREDQIIMAETEAALPGGTIPIRYTGGALKDEDGKIVGGVEFVLDISDEMAVTTELVAVSAAAVAGKLDVRGDLDKFEGNYKSIVEGVNNTLDAVIGPLNMAAEYIERISKGDIPEVITDDYNGDFNEIKNNLNLLVNSTNEMAELVSKVAGGELRLEVKKRSENDAVMISLAKMVIDLTDIASNMQTAADQVAEGSQQISASAEEMSQGATEQAASVEEVSSSMEEMNSSVSQNADNARETASIAKKAANDAQEGGKSVNETVSAMKSIADKITIIQEIAQQTNMLSLNAAIEAGRAGEHGKGFAVVAAEVRKLAERSQIAAKEIGGLSKSSVEIAEKAGKLIEEVVPGILRTAELVDEINASSSEQAKGIEQVTKAVQQLDQVIQQSASGTEEMASTSEELASQAEQMQSTVAFFKTDASQNNNQNQFVASRKPIASARPQSQPQHQYKVAPPVHNTNSSNNGAGIKLDMSDETDNSFEKF